jgi:hypothetical protein
MLANLTNITLDESVFPLAAQGALIINQYIIRITGGVGVLVNLFFVVLLCHTSLRHNIYKFLWCRQFINLVACFQIATSNGFCSGCSFDSEWMAYYSWCSQVTIRVFLLASFISDILLILNRYFEIVQTPTFLSRLSKKLNLLICFAISFIVISPGYFPFYVFKTPLQEKYQVAWNAFGVSDYFKVFVFVLFLFEVVIPLFIFLCLSIVSKFKFERLMQRHGQLTGNQTEAINAETRFTKMVLIFSVTILLTRLCDLITTVFGRLASISPVTFNKGSLELITFSKSVSLFFIYIALDLDGFIYLRMDKNIWALILRLTKRNRVI